MAPIGTPSMMSMLPPMMPPPIMTTMTRMAMAAAVAGLQPAGDLTCRGGLGERNPERHRERFKANDER